MDEITSSSHQTSNDDHESDDTNQHDSSKQESKSKMKSKVRKTFKTRDYVADYVDDLIKRLDKMNLEFLTSRSKLIDQLYEFDGKQMSYFKTEGFKRRKTETEAEYIYSKPVRIDNVIHGKVKIWSEKEKKAQRRIVDAQWNPRGVDPGNIETARTHGLIDLCPEVVARFRFDETVRGSFVDIIAIKIGSQIVFGLQIATATQSKINFYFSKTIEQILKYLEKNLVVLLIGTVNNQIAGVYMIPPTQSVKDALGKFKKTMWIVPSMLNKKPTTLLFYKYLENFRYIHEDFKNGVEGTFKTFGDFSTDFLALADNYPHIVSTSYYLSSLFIDASNRTEWASNMSFTNNVACVMKNMKEKLNHGERGDRILEFSGKSKYTLKDERKTLGVNRSGILKWILDLRKPGQQGLNPQMVNIITAIMRLDRDIVHPSEPEQFGMIIVLPILTASGDIALRPDNPAARNLHIVYDIAKGGDYIQVRSARIGAGTYPDDMQSTDGKRTLIKAVFHYKDLIPGSKRLKELQNLYKLFASRTPNANAIEAYERAINDEVIDKEVAKRQKKNAAKREEKKKEKQQKAKEEKDKEIVI